MPINRRIDALSAERRFFLQPPHSFRSTGALMRCQQKGDFFSNHRIVSVWLPPGSCGVASQERRSEEQVVTRHNKPVSERIPKSLAIIAEVKKFEMSGRPVLEHEVGVESHDTPPDAVNCVPY